MKLASLVLVLVGCPTFADDLPLPVPALFDVTGVAANDTLNVRAFPDAASPVVGELHADAAAIEVVAYSRLSEWALVNVDGQSGWVASRFLAPAVVETNDYGLPAGMTCFGTEPFWSANFAPKGLEVTTPDTQDAPEVHDIIDLAPPTDGPRDLTLGLLFTWLNNGDPVTARILPGKCSDGMSDRQYGLHYSDPVLGTGCCSLAP
jgi:uncharacterized membrane protein